MIEEGYKCIECEIEDIKECYLECEECGEYTCEGNGECIDCGSDNLKVITEVNSMRLKDKNKMYVFKSIK
jgi:hypothetical protein